MLRKIFKFKISPIQKLNVVVSDSIFELAEAFNSCVCAFSLALRDFFNTVVLMRIKPWM